MVALVSGNGIPYQEQEKNWRRLLIISMVKGLYRMAFKMTDRIWFQNPDDMAFYIKNKLASKNKCILIRGSGVNLEEFSPIAVEQNIVQALQTELGISTTEKKVFMLVARFIWSKGIKEYVEAAKILKKQNCKVKLYLFGPYDLKYQDAVPLGYLEQNTSDHFQPVIGFRTEVREILSLSDIVALPSYSREGVPCSLLETLAMGKPVITTDHPGCREVVDPGFNGYLVPVKDPKALAAAIMQLAQDDSLIKNFGVHSRRKAELEFDEKLVFSRVIQELYGGLEH